VGDLTTLPVLFPELFDRPLIARFDRPHASPEGGAILLKAADRRLGLMAAPAGCLRSGPAGAIEHVYGECGRELATRTICLVG
jgi:hypothetical protein